MYVFIGINIGIKVLRLYKLRYAINACILDKLEPIFPSVKFTMSIR